MMDQEKYKKILLDKFLRKDLTRDERHELEKLALDDPFLFEAMQGFTEVDADHAADLKIIKAKKLGKPSKRKSLVPYGIAASLLILVGLSVWTLGSRSGMDTDNTFAEAKEESSTSKSRTSVASAPIPNDANRDDAIDVNTKLEGNIAKSKMADSISTEIISEGEQIAILEEEVPGTREISPYDLEDYEAENEAIGNNNGSVQNGSAPSEVRVMAQPPPPPPAVEDDFEVIAESYDEEIVEEATEAIVLDEVKVMKAKDQLGASKKEKKNEQANFGDAPSGAAATFEMEKESSNAEGNAGTYEQYFSDALKDKFSLLETRRIKKQVAIQCDIIDGKVLNFQSIPAQSSEINAKLQAILEDGLQYLPSNVEAYKLDLRSL